MKPIRRQAGIENAFEETTPYGYLQLFAVQDLLSTVGYETAAKGQDRPALHLVTRLCPCSLGERRP